MAGSLRQHGMPIALLGADELRERDHAAAAGDVHHLRVGDDAFDPKRFRDGAGDEVLAASRAARGNEFESVHLREAGRGEGHHGCRRQGGAKHMSRHY